jgi:hypothetical protein
LGTLAFTFVWDYGLHLSFLLQPASCSGATAAYAAWRIARSNAWAPSLLLFQQREQAQVNVSSIPVVDDTTMKEVALVSEYKPEDSWQSMRDGLPTFSSNYSFLIKLFIGCAVGSYAVKYGETWLSVPIEADLVAALSIIGIVSSLNGYRWYRKSQDPSFNGWL